MECKKCKSPLADEFVFCPYCGQNQKKAVKKRKTLKRENGTGSVYYRKDLKSRPWEARTPFKNGRREVIGHYKTAQEAKDALHEYCKNPTDKLNYTLSDVYEAWLPSIKDKSKQHKDCCRAAYNKMADLYKTKMKDLRTDDFQKIVDYHRSARPKLNKKGEPILNKDGTPAMTGPASYSSLADIRGLATALSDYALKEDIINKSYASFIAIPPKPKGVKDCFTSDELIKITNAAFGLNGTPKIPYADYVLFMCYTGLRITEFLTLTKNSVYEKNGEYTLYGGIKTDAGEEKIVPVYSLIVPILKERLAYGGQTLFCRPEKTPFTSGNFRNNYFNKVLKQIGVRELTPHATRRTMATLMSKAKVRPEDFIVIMGHADYKVDIESYIYQDAEKLRPSIEAFSKIE